MIKILIGNIDVSGYCLQLGSIQKRIESEQDDLAGVIVLDTVSMEFPSHAVPMLAEDVVNTEPIPIEVFYNSEHVFSGYISVESLTYNLETFTTSFTAVEKLGMMREQSWSGRLRYLLTPQPVTVVCSSDTIVLTYSAVPINYHSGFFRRGMVIGVYDPISETDTENFFVILSVDESIPNTIILRTTGTPDDAMFAGKTLTSFSDTVSGYEVLDADSDLVLGNELIRALVGISTVSVWNFGSVSAEEVAFGDYLPNSRFDLFKKVADASGYAVQRGDMLQNVRFSEMLVSKPVHVCADVQALQVKKIGGKRLDKITVSMLDGFFELSRSRTDVPRPTKILEKEVAVGIFTNIEEAADMYEEWYLRDRAGISGVVGLPDFDKMITIVPTDKITAIGRNWVVLSMNIDLTALSIQFTGVEV